MNFADNSILFDHSLKNTNAFDMSPNTDKVYFVKVPLCQDRYSRYL